MMDQALRAYFVVNVAMLVMLGVVLPFQERGTAAFVITVAALVVVVASVLVSGAVIYFQVRIPPMGERPD